MIEGISRIKGLGVYADYKPAQGMHPFGLKNIIYGWNASGKTTLSRVFAMLERRKPDPALPAFEFSFATAAGAIDHTNYQSNPLQVRVFNSDFVAANLNFVGDHFNPIFLLGEESKAALERIERCEALIARLDIKDAAIKRIEEQAASDASAARTAAASMIREALSLTSPFRANHLEKEAVLVRSVPAAAKLGEEALRSDLRMARSADHDRLPAIGSASFDARLDSIREAAEPVLAKVPDMANTIDHLLKHPEVEQWVGAGLPLHVHEESCAFCGGGLTDGRLAELRAHFSMDMKIQAGRIFDLLTKADKAKLSFAPRAAAELYAPFRERYAAAAKALLAAIGRHNSALDDIEEALKRKGAAPRSAMEMRAREPGPWIDVAGAAMALNEVAEENDKTSTNFDESKSAAIRRLKAHYAAEFVEAQDFDAQERASQARSARRGRLHRWRNMARTEASAQRAVINRAQRGREEINERVESLLGPACVRIEVVEVAGEDRFRLTRRDGRAATHLSEGEKTAIAFAYFLAKLKELPELGEAIVCIDDPISSLDSNQVFHVVAVIRDVFFHKVEGGTEPGWRPRCKQLFILTHHFTFFAMMRELQPDKLKTNRSKHYFVKRRSSSESALVNLPAALLNYSSEYHFLFGVLNRFRQERGDAEMELLLMLPNAMRRFVELYTYARMPAGDEVSVDARAEKLFGVETAKRVLKALHYFSHGNSIERLAENNDLICDIESSIEQMLAHIETHDPIHWEALVGAHKQDAAKA